MEAGTATLFFILGLIVGSFLNVVVLRHGFRERPSARSRCTQCDAPIGARDLIPIVSFVLLRGRCRTCGSALSVHYPLVELGTAVLFSVSASMLLPAAPFTLLALLGFWAAFIAIVAYDFRHTLIPLPFLYTLLAFGALTAVARAWEAWSLVLLGEAVLGAALCGGFFALIHAVTRGRGMGIGDAYVAAAIGLAFGLFEGIAASVLGVWIGAATGLLIIALQRLFPHAHLNVLGRRVTLSSEIPFAPFLLIGAAAALVLNASRLLFG